MPEKQIFEVELIDDYWEYTKDVKKSFNSRYWSILASISGIVIIFINVSITWEQLQEPYRSSLEHATFVVIWFFLTCYILSLTVIREIVNIFWLYRLFHEIPIRVQLMHPDRAGGFRFIGQYFSVLTYLVIAIGYGLSIDFFIMPLINGEPIYLGPEVIFAWMLYLILVPTSFITPLWSIHQAMKQKKATVLKIISDQFNHGVNETLSSLNGDEGTISKNLEKTKELQKIYSLIEDQYPTWPLSLHQRRNLSISALIPIITSIGSLVIEYLL